MFLLPLIYSSPERYEVKTPLERKVTERGLLGVVCFSMKQFVGMHFSVLIQLTKVEEP